MIDERFIPLAKQLYEYRKVAKDAKTVRITLFRVNGVATHEEKFDGSELAFTLIERIVKSMIWVYGGYKICINDEAVAMRLKSVYENERKFDADFMSSVYAKPFEVVFDETLYQACDEKIEIKETKGLKIGLDLGGTSVKASTVKDGEEIKSEVVSWKALDSNDIEYHYSFLCSVIEKMSVAGERVEGVGISTAGVVCNNELAISLLLRNVKRETYENLFARISQRFSLPVTVVNDGDVSAMCAQKEGNVLGIALGTSEAGGYINDGYLSGRLNELAFVPFCFYDGDVDEWSGDSGCGVNFISQHGVRTASKSLGYNFEGTDTEVAYAVHAEAQNDENLAKTYDIIGEYLGWALLWYNEFYTLDTVCLAGGVMSGTFSGNIVKRASEILNAHGCKILVEKACEGGRFAQSIQASKL